MMFARQLAFFWICSAVVRALSYACGWGAGRCAFRGDLMAAVTLALVALLKNAERRAEHAVQYTLDAIARAMLEPPVAR